MHSPLSKVLPKHIKTKNKHNQAKLTLFPLRFCRELFFWKLFLRVWGVEIQTFLDETTAHRKPQENHTTA